MNLVGSNANADTDVQVDVDGGGNAFVTMATIDGLGFVDAGTSATTLDDNIIVA